MTRTLKTLAYALLLAAALFCLERAAHGQHYPRFHRYAMTQLDDTTTLDMVKDASDRGVYTITSTNGHFLNDTNAKRTIETGTQVNNELSVVARGGKWHIAFSSQGKTASNEKVYRKLYIKTIQPL